MGPVAEPGRRMKANDAIRLKELEVDELVQSTWPLFEPPGRA